MAQNLTVIALDLDFTLARFRSGYSGIYDIVETYGIPRESATKKLRMCIDSTQ